MAYTQPPPGGWPPPGASPYGTSPPPHVPVDHPSGVPVLVLGIASWILCGLLGPVAWIMGNRAINEIDAYPGRYRNRGTVQTGRILGMVVSILLGLAVVGGLAALVVVAVAEDAERSEPQPVDPRCPTDTRTQKTAILAWNAEYVGGGSTLPTPWPRSEDELVYARLLTETSPLHDVEGDGSSPPTISAEGPACADEEIVQLD